MALISYLQVEDLTKSYGDRMLFDSITFGVNQGDKIGVIAKNGTGKSTLLRLIAGKEPIPDRSHSVAASESQYWINHRYSLRQIRQ